MNLQEAIRKHRKAQNLTQEQLANYLGVTAPAVNKWENGSSYPDITLLAPLARILRTDVDTLLSFHEELTEKEINQFLMDISKQIATEGYAQAFEMVSQKIKEYPNCDRLVLYASQILNGYLEKQEMEQKEMYRKKILSWMELVAKSKDSELANMAAMSISQIYMNEGEYERAQTVLDGMSSPAMDKRIIQATLYWKQGKEEESFRIQEEMVYEKGNSILLILTQLITRYCEKEEYEQAKQYAKMARGMAEVLGLGMYSGVAAEFVIACARKDTDWSLTLLEEMMEALENDQEVVKARYPHMTVADSSSMAELKAMLKQSLEKEDEYAYLRGEKRFEAIQTKG